MGIRACSDQSVTWGKFATDRILARAFKADLDGLFFAFATANLAWRVLAQAWGSEAQAVALMDNWINWLVRDRARAAALQFDLSSVAGFGLLSGLDLGLGFNSQIRCFLSGHRRTEHNRQPSRNTCLQLHE